MDKKLKIAIIGSRGYPYVYSGYETLVKELSERIVKRGHNVTVYCHSSLFKHKPKKINGVNLVYTPSIETKFLSQITNSFFSFIHVCFTNIDIVLVLNSANGPFGLLTKLFGIKTCINVDGMEWLRPKWKGIGSFYFKIASKLATIFFDEIITDSVEMKKIYQKKFGVNSYVIAYGSTMVKSLDKIKDNKFNLTSNSYYLIVGRLIPDNNVFLIVKGFIKSKTSKKLVVVGDVPYNDKYAQKIKSIQNKKILITGYIRDTKQLSYLYNNCFCYIHGHEFGGTNPTMINALDLNCNIISLRTKFNQEMLKGKDAILFDKNINSVVNTLNNYNPKKPFKVYTLPKIYDWEFITKKYLDVFNNIIQSKK